MKSAAKLCVRNASKKTERKENALATCDKNDSPGYLPREKRNNVRNQPKKRFSKTLKRRDTSRILRHERTSAMDGLHIEDEEDHVRIPG